MRDLSVNAAGAANRGADAPVATILVVEDDESVRLTLQGIPEAESYRVEQATHLREALAKIERTQFDVLLLDLQLGGADGVSALRRLREISTNAVGIIVTGFGSFDNAVQAVRAGADDFLVKPSDMAELKASISRALARRARADEHARQVIPEQTATAEAARAAAEAARQHLYNLSSSRRRR